ncbi:MAG: acylglycerol kinase family protein, partial [Candidatus Tectomicrobia bacterium]|nr:acylglycerol kinase family protein [Candidatus Tectomicrobia bacterium]
MSTPIVILYNPQAGLASSQDELHRAITAMKSQGTPIRLLSLPRDKPWRVQIESLLEDGMGTFIAAGGDGT